MGGADEIDQAAHRAATSPHNDLPEPTEGQKKAGNYPKGHVRLHGLDISIENPRGSERSGTDRSGKAWSVTMAHHYGYFKGTVGRDKDHIDVFIGPNPASAQVYVVDQIDPETGKFDEHKVLLGFDSAQEARAGYLANYEKGWQGIGVLTPAGLDEFKHWLETGDTKRPYGTLSKTETAGGKAPLPQPSPAGRVGENRTKSAEAETKPAGTGAEAGAPRLAEDEGGLWDAIYTLSRNGVLDPEGRRGVLYPTLHVIGGQHYQIHGDRSVWIPQPMGRGTGGDGMAERKATAKEVTILEQAMREDGVQVLLLSPPGYGSGYRQRKVIRVLHHPRWNSFKAAKAAPSAEKPKFSRQATPFRAPDVRDAEGRLLAPDGSPSKLSEEQWHAARSPAFKEVFGDWDWAWHQGKIDALRSITVDWKPTSDIPAQVRHPVLEETQKRLLTDTEGTVAPRAFIAPNGDEIWVSMSGLRESVSGHAGAQKMRILPVLDRLIQNSHFVLSAPDDKSSTRKSRNVLGYRYYVAKAALDGKPYYVKLAVREVEDKGVHRKFYDHDLSEVGEVTREQGTAHLQEAAGHPTAATSLDFIRHHGWQKFNGEISGPVDGNGEPQAEVVQAFLSKGGEPRFSRSAARKSGLTTERLQALLSERFGKGVARLGADGTLHIVQSVADLPAGIRNATRGDEEGVYWRGTAYLVADNVTASRASAVLLHELGEHYGLERMLGETAYQQLHKRIRLMRGAGNVRVRAAWDAVLREYRDADGRLLFPEGSERHISEVIARLGENNVFEKSAWWKDLLAKIKAFLLRMGFAPLARTLTDADLNALLVASVRAASEQAGKPRLYPAPAQASRPAGIFYSELAQQLGQVKAAKAPPAQWKAIIAGLKQKGVKQDEIEWSGVTDWLDLQKGPVTREQVQAFVEGNGVRVEEVGKGWQTRYFIDTFTPTKGSDAGKTQYLIKEKRGDHIKVYRVFYSRDAAEREMQSMIAGGGGSDTKFSQWQLPGGENYKELLITLPQTESELWQVFRMDDGAHVAWHTSEAEARSDAEQRGDDFDYELASRPKEPAKFRSAHFDESNILAHIRFNERAGTDRRPVLFLEEIQSDWGQQGKKTGFVTQQQRNELNRAYEGWLNSHPFPDIKLTLEAATDERNTPARKTAVARLRGEIARLLGYQAVEMADEHGTSYLVLPGVIPQPLVQFLAAYSREFGVSAAQLRKEFEVVAIRHLGSMAAYEALPAAPGRNGLKAPNGKPTKLNKQQWVMVRTPRFKAWFGDWEGGNALVEQIPLELSGWSGSASDLSALAREIYTNELQGSTVENASLGGEVAFSSEGKGEAFGARGKLRNPVRAEIVKVLREVVRNSVKVTEEVPKKGRENDTRAFHTLVAPLSVNGEAHAVKVTVREALRVPAGDTAHKFYDVTTIQIERSPGVHGFDNAEASSHPAPSEASGIRVADLARAFNLEVRINTDSVSKVVDDNGEPLVMYHGTDNDFARFLVSRLGENTIGNASSKELADTSLVGFWFSDEPIAQKRTGPFSKMPGRLDMPVFLNIKEPLEFRDLDDIALDIHNDGGARKWRSLMLSGGYDGARVVLDEETRAGSWIALKATQIKSATGNTGEFSPTNPDIRRSQDGDALEAARLYRDMGTESPFFKSWFGESKVQKAGKPMVVYHGTNTELEFFDDAKLGAATRHATAQLGHFFTTDQGAAREYAQKAAERRGGRATVGGYYLRIENPYVVTSDLLDKRMGGLSPQAFREALIEGGNDGIYIKDAGYVVAFWPEQVKSVDNLGTFDPGDRRMRYSRGEIPEWRQASTFDEAREAAKAFQGKPLRNTATNRVATVSRNNLDKMLSASAVHKSETAAEHAAAVANLDRLFETAILGWSKPDRESDVNLVAIHRYFAPMRVGDRDRLVKLTVKEFARSDQGTKIYSVETVEVERISPAAWWVDSTVRDDGLDPTSIRSVGDVKRLIQEIENVNRGGEGGTKYSRGTLPSPEEGIDPVQRRKVQDWWDRMDDTIQEQQLGFVTRDQLAVISHDLLPEIEDQYLRIARQADGTRNEVHGRLGAFMRPWAEMARKKPPEAARLANVMHEATIAGVDPARAYRPVIDIKAGLAEIRSIQGSALTAKALTPEQQERINQIKRLIRQEMERKPQYSRIRELYDGLGQEAKVIYRAARSFHEWVSRETLRELEARVENTEASQRVKRDLIAKLRLEFESNRVTAPYFPLARFGKYWISYRMPQVTRADFPLRIEWIGKDRFAVVGRDAPAHADRLKQLGGRYVQGLGRTYPAAKEAEVRAELGKLLTERVNYTDPGERYVEFFESSADRDEYLQMIERDGGEILGAGIQFRQDRKGGDAPGFGAFVAEVEGLVKELGDSQAVRQLQDDIWQLYLKTMPELSSRRHMIHRQKRPGYSTDALRANTQKGFHDGYMLSRLQHVTALQEVIDGLKRKVETAASTLRMQKTRQQLALWKEYQAERGRLDLDAIDKKLAELNGKLMAGAGGELIRGDTGEVVAGTGDRTAEAEHAKWTRFREWFRNGFSPALKIAEAEERIGGAERIRGRGQEGIDQANRYIHELEGFHQLLLNPDSNTLASSLNSLGFVWYLGAGAATGLVNTLQTPVVAMPMAGAKYGEIKTTAAFARAARQFFSTPKMTLGVKLRGEELRAFREFQRIGVIDKTLSHDLAGVSEEGMDYSGRRFRTMQAVSWWFHHTERFNREVTAMAVYRLAREAGETEEQAFWSTVKLVDRSHGNYEAVNRARFMRGTTGRVGLQFKQYPQFTTFLLLHNFRQAFKGADARERKIAQKTLAGILFAQALVAGVHGLPWLVTAAGLPIVYGGRKGAAAVAGSGLTMALGPVAGILLAPVAGGALAKKPGAFVATAAAVALYLAAEALDDPDDPEDWDAKFRTAIAKGGAAAGKAFGLEGEAAEKFGSVAESLIWNGLLDTVTGWSVSSRASMTEMWLHTPDKELEGEEGAMWVIETLFGPMVGIVKNLAVGAAMIHRGLEEENPERIARGVEHMLPNAAKYVLRAYRMEEEGGAKSLSGGYLMENPTAVELLGQAMGFTPQRLATRYDLNRAMQNLDRALGTRRQRLLTRVSAGLMEGDQDKVKRALDEASAFAVRNPERAIGKPDIRASVRGRARREDLSESGVYLSKKAQGLRERYRFGGE